MIKNMSKSDIDKYIIADEDNDIDVLDSLSDKYGYSDIDSFDEDAKKFISSLQGKSTPQIKKEEERSTEIENASSKSEQKKIASEQRGEDLLGKTVSISIDDIANAYAPNNEQVKSLIKLQPSNNYGGAMTRLIVGSDNNNKPIYETNQEYIDRNNAAFESMGLDWSNKSDRALVAKELEDTEVKKSKKDIKEGKGSIFDKSIKYGSDIVFPRTTEEFERRLDDPNSTGEIPFKDLLSDSAENIIQTVTYPVTGPLKAAGRLAPKAAKAIGKVVDANVVTRYVPKLLDNLGDVTESELMDKMVYGGDTTNPRSGFNVSDVVLGGGVNTVAPYMLDRQTGRLGRRLDLTGKKVLNKAQGGVTSKQLRDEAKELKSINDDALIIRNSIVNEYAKPYGGNWNKVPPEVRSVANADLLLRLKKAGPEVENAYRYRFNLEDERSPKDVVPTKQKDEIETESDDVLWQPLTLKAQADWLDFVNEGDIVPPKGKIRIKKDPNDYGIDPEGNVTDEFGMPKDELPPTPIYSGATYKTKPKSIFTVLNSDIPDLATSFKNRKPVEKKIPNIISIAESYDPRLSVRDRPENIGDKLWEQGQDRFATWLPNKTGKSDMVKSLPVISSFWPTDEELEEQSLIDSAPTLRTTEPTSSSKNLFSALNNIPYYVEDEDEEDPYDISFMPISNRYVKKAGK